MQVTLVDSETLAKPLTISSSLNYLADTDPEELVCNENERDRAHIVTGELKPKIQLSAAALAKYAGTYEPGDVTISLVNGQLYFWDIPLFPRSETLFDSRLNTLEFSVNASGEVTGVTFIARPGTSQSASASNEWPWLPVNQRGVMSY